MTFRTLLYIFTTAIFLACNSNSANDYLNLGHDIGMQGNYQKAILIYNKAIEIDPKLKEAYVQKGLCYEYLNKVDSAIKVYSDLLRIDPGNTTALYFIGLCRYEQKKFPEAIDFYNKALISGGVANPEDSSNAQIFITWNKNFMTEDQAAFYIPT